MQTLFPSGEPPAVMLLSFSVGAVLKTHLLEFRARSLQSYRWGDRRHSKLLRSQAVLEVKLFNDFRIQLPSKPVAVLVMTLAPHIVHSDPDILGGTPVFVGTRVPVKNLLDYLEAGDSLEVFLGHFPSVSCEQAIAALELAKEMLTAYADPA